MRSDPSGTYLAARSLARDVVLRFERVAEAISRLVGTDDCFGLEQGSSALATNAEKAVWRFHTDAQKVDAFNGWLRNQVQHDVLETDHLGRPWLEKALRDTYGKGLGRGYVDMRGKSLKGGTPAFLAGSKHEFVRRALTDPQIMARIQLLSSRAFEELKGLSTVAGTQLNRILVRGLIQKTSAKKLAKEMSEKVEGLSKERALLIAQTELVHANSESLLDAYESFGVQGVTLYAEWATSGRGNVCPSCLEMEGTVFTIKEMRGLIPFHPRCACSPVVTTKAPKPKEQIAAIEDALRAQTGSKSKVNPGRKSSWAGKVLARKLRAKAVGPTSNAARAVGARRLALVKKSKPKGKMAPMSLKVDSTQQSWLTSHASKITPAQWSAPPVVTFNAGDFDPAKHPHDALGHWATVPGHKLPANGAKDEIPVRAKHKGKEIHGVLKGLSTIHVDGLNLGAPSAAGAHVTGGTSVNGWKFWQYQSDDGKWHDVHEIRPVAAIKKLTGAGDQMKSLINQGKTKDEILAHFTAEYDKIGQKDPAWVAKKVAQLHADATGVAKKSWEKTIHKPGITGTVPDGAKASAKVATAPPSYTISPDKIIAAAKTEHVDPDLAFQDEPAPDDEPTAASPGLATFTPEAAKEFFAKKFGQTAPKVVKQVADPLLPTPLPHAPPKTAPPTMPEKQEMGIKLTAAISKFPPKFKIATPAGEVVWAKIAPYTLGAPKSASHVDWATGIPQIVVKGYDDGSGLGTWQPGHLHEAINAVEDLKPVEKAASATGGKQLTVDLHPIDHWVKSDRSRGSGNTMSTAEKTTHHANLLKEQGVNKTASDLAAIKTFTGGSSGSINKEMNEGIKTGPYAVTIKDLMKAAAKARFKEPVELYRGMTGCGVDDIAEWIQRADSGLPIEMKSFQSHSTSKPWYEENKHAPGNVQFIVRTKQGLTVHHDSAFPNELEVIMPPTKYRVHKYVLTAPKHSGAAPGLVAWLDDVGG